jgi:uncharacterized LabA/DUF88 family protein
MCRPLGIFNNLILIYYEKEREHLPTCKEQVASYLYTMAMKHVGKRNTLYRIFYYDCFPLAKKVHNPISKKLIDFSTTEEYKFRTCLLEALKRKRKVALRIGTLKDNHNWQIYPNRVKELLAGKKKIDNLTETEIYLDVRQKGIDMKIGVDIATLALKGFIDTIVLFSGDSDFVPAAKLARREGIDFILDPMQANVEPQLFEHVDGITSLGSFYSKDNNSI